MSIQSPAPCLQKNLNTKYHFVFLQAFADVLHVPYEWECERNEKQFLSNFTDPNMQNRTTLLHYR